MAIRVIVDSRQDHRAASAATGRRAEGVRKTSPVRRQRVEIGCLNHTVAETTGVLSLVVGDNQYDVSTGRVDVGGE